MKCFRDTVTLFCPNSDGEREEYLLTDVRLSLSESTSERGGVLFFFNRRSRAYSGDRQAELPMIYSGCAVAVGDLRGLPSEDGGFPDVPALSVVEVESFTSETGRGDHIKLTLG